MIRREKVAIGLGSNLGNRLDHLSEAVQRMVDDFLLKPQVSRVYESPPWGYLEQGPFLNAVLVGVCDWDAEALINYMKCLEREMGRVKTIENGPRIIDCDLLAHGENCFEEKDMIVPHEQMFERDFVLLPFFEVWPDWVHPKTGQSVKQVRENYDENLITSTLYPRSIDFKSHA